MKVCSVCGSTKRACNYKSKTPVCQKHYDQLRYHGKIVYIKKENNKILYCGENAYIILIDKNGKEKAKAIIDTRNVDKIKNQKWCFDGRYVVSLINNKRVMLHRIIINTPKHLVTDHLNHNTLDNRESNLRACTQKENLLNKKIA